ncbi:MAG: hypothetical protein ACD_19C00426G0050 [uncultured bacterium]|nr:MAG: hypothetical protein ACD_19C00426G0050 [uncultured bacterium]
MGFFSKFFKQNPPTIEVTQGLTSAKPYSGVEAPVTNANLTTGKQEFKDVIQREAVFQAQADIEKPSGVKVA